MRLALAALLLVPTLANAAPPCWPWEPSAKNVELSTTPESKSAFIMATEGSFILTWWCDARYFWVSNGVVGNRSDLAPDWLSVARQAYGDVTRAEALLATADCKLSDPLCTKYDELKPLLYAQYQATQPEDIIWKVRTNGTQTSRPVFPMPVGGARSATASPSARVDVGARCSCDIQVSEETGGTYCSVEGNANAASAATRALPIPAGLVALCAR